MAGLEQQHLGKLETSFSLEQGCSNWPTGQMQSAELYYPACGAPYTSENLGVGGAVAINTTAVLHCQIPEPCGGLEPGQRPSSPCSAGLGLSCLLPHFA